MTKSARVSALRARLVDINTKVVKMNVFRAVWERNLLVVEPLTRTHAVIASLVNIKI